MQATKNCLTLQEKDEKHWKMKKKKWKLGKNETELIKKFLLFFSYGKNYILLANIFENN